MPIVTSIATKAIVTVQSYENRELKGTVYNGFYDKKVPFRNSFEMISVLENLFDSLSFPQSSVTNRSFYKRAKRQKRKGSQGEHMEGNVTSTGKAKFVVYVQYRQNATWQGTIQWVDENKTQRFRSALEMLKLMDEALGETEDDTEISFEQEEN